MTSRKRVLAALNHQDPDRVPVWEYFWPEFEDKWRKIKKLPSNEDIYRYYKIDLREVSCKRWPRIDGRLTIKKSSQYEILKDGWGAIVKELPHSSTPQYLEFPIKKKQDIDKYEFESPKDPIRYTDFVKEVEDNKDMALFGHITGPYGLLWHTRGPEQSFYDIAEDPNFVRALVEKLTEGMIEIGLQQLERSKGLLLGIWIADDIAYNKGLMFSPETYYKLFWPSLRRMCESFKKRGAKIIYHSDGDIREAIDMLIEAGVDAINPLEVRAGMDVVKLKEKYEGRLSFIGNIDNTGTLRTGTKQDIEKEVIRKLKAAKGGGYIIGSSHSIGPDVPIENYEYFLQIVRGDAK